MKKSAFVIISRDQTDVLLTKRKDVPVWVLPGGGVESNESPQDAAVREAMEETGLQISIERLTGHYHPVNRLAQETFVYSAHPVAGSLTLSDETSDVQYFPFDQLPKSLFFLHQHWITDWKSSPVTVTRQLSQVNYFQVMQHLLRHPFITLRFLWTRWTKGP